MKYVEHHAWRWIMPGTDFLWAWVALMAFAFLISLVPLPPNDFWWHLRVGQIILETGKVPTANLFAWTLPVDHPFVYAAWLGELGLAVLHRLGGLDLVLCTRTVIVVGAFWLMAVEAKRRSGCSWRIVALPLALAGAMALNNVIVRPQMWSLLPFALYVLLLQRYAEGVLGAQWLLLCPLLMVVWVNVHGAFVLGGVLLLIYAAGAGLRALTGPEKDGAVAQFRWLIFIGILTVLAMLVNPQGPGIFAYVVNLMTDRPSQELVVEWQSPTPKGIANTAFFVDVLLLLIVFAYSRYRPTFVEAVSVGAFLWLAWSGQRYVIWFALVSLPVLTRALMGLPIRLPTFPPRRNVLNTWLAGLLFVPVLLVQPWWVEHVPLPRTYWAQVQMDTEAGPLVDTATPVGAAAYLREHPGGHLFNEMGYGSYLIWAVPEQKVFIDPRVELYPYEMWQDYVRIGRGVRYEALLSRYGADRVLLDRSLQAELAEQLASNPSWILEYEDAYSQIWYCSP